MSAEHLLITPTIPTTAVMSPTEDQTVCACCTQILRVIIITDKEITYHRLTMHHTPPVILEELHEEVLEHRTLDTRNTVFCSRH